MTETPRNAVRAKALAAVVPMAAAASARKTSVIWQESAAAGGSHVWHDEFICVM